MSDHLPIDPASGQPIPPQAQPGYYPGWHVLSQQAFWDEATRDVILDRFGNVPPIRFFADQQKLAEAVFNRILPQDDREPGYRIPVLNYVDARLYEDVQDGYRYVGMPPNGEAYRLGLRGIDEAAQHLHGHSFVELNVTEQDGVLLSVRNGHPPGDSWSHLPPIRFWELLVADAVDAYYSHPYAWDEIGFGGPAYPRGYMRIGGLPEPWEVDEERYEWEPPPAARSGSYQALAGLYSERPTPSQGGTH